MELFDSKRLYRKPEIMAVTGWSDRTTDTRLTTGGVTRLRFSNRDVRYSGAELNALLSRAAEHGTERATPSGAVADAIQRARRS